ncbi:MAG: Fic family protein [Candidatus Saganbacteria bacterium]|nr:Fic family protein [Candidatus Saganbacteria bacterium]
MFEFENKIKECELLKKELDAFRPFPGPVISQLKEYYKINLTYTSNNIEGNSLTESETKVVIEDGITIGGKPLKDHLEALGHALAYDFIYALVEKKKGISEQAILKTHHLFYEKIDEDNAGKYRQVQVFVSGTDDVFPTPQTVPALMSEFAKEMPVMQKKLHPIEFAAWLHCKLVNIHPFIDGNGRVARLLLNLALLQAGYVITIIPPTIRLQYIETVKTCQKSGNSQPFYGLISNMVWEALKEQQGMIRGKV